MELFIADTFTASFAKLTGDEQKAVKITAFDLQVNPANRGMQFHRIDKSRDPNFWSIRVSRDIRIIVHKTAASLLLCYVAHHDDAYTWAERRKIERHPKTGAAQLVEVRETVRDIAVPRYVEVEQPAPVKPPLFAKTDDDVLLSYGVPPEWLADVKTATEDTIFAVAEYLPQEAAEALLELATGGVPQPKPIPAVAEPFEHPDAQRRFKLLIDADELQQALNYPWEKWSVFLHPTQRDLVERHFNGPAKIAGSAGTGKTIVALHRAVYLARKHRDSRILLTTFSETLTDALRHRLNMLCTSCPRLAENIEVHAIDQVGNRLYRAGFSAPRIAAREQITALLKEAAANLHDHRFTLHFLFTEWFDVVDAWQLQTWDEYRTVQRLGRKTRLTEPQRQALWSVFDNVRNKLAAQNLITPAAMFNVLADKLTGHTRPPFDYAIIDEAQDLTVMQLLFLAALGGNRPDSLYFTGDLGQRIFQQPFSWKALGIDIQGRSHVLKVNYRTSHHIRAQADRLLPPSLSDVDGNTESRQGTISMFAGTPPTIQTFPDADTESRHVGQWIHDLIQNGTHPHEIAVFVRSAAQQPRAHAALDSADISWVDLDAAKQAKQGHVSVCTMHLAKGLEFRAVAVIACDDEVIPLQERIESAGDASDLEDVYQTERHLLYVACTRARDHLLITAVTPVSEFLTDMQPPVTES